MSAGALFAKQQRRDEETTQREKQVDPDRAFTEHPRQQVRRRVVPNDGQNRQTTQALKTR